MYHKQIISPYKPLLDSNTDTKHFDQDILNMPIESPPQEMKSSPGYANSSNMDQDDFDGFSFEAHTITSPNNLANL